jgi:hypothetical protein
VVPFPLPNINKHKFYLELWDEFGDEVETFEGWKFDFKFSSLYIPPEAEHD